MKHLLVFFLLIFSAFYSHAAPEGAGVERAINQSIELYNKRQYTESLAVLDTVKQSRDQVITWYYYYGLNQARLGYYDEALANLDIYIKRSELANTAKAYYFSGLIQFYKGEYDKAVNSLELSLDLSRDPKLDKSTDMLIERTLKYREYYESHKPTNLTFLLGYSYDTNVLNLSRDSFSENLSGHLLNYGFSISHRAVDQYNFVFEPSFAVLDNYTLDNSLKATSTIQANDVLQVLFSAPVIFYFDNEKSATRYDFSINAYTSYLPLTSSSRELYLTSFFFKAKTLSQLSAYYNLNVTGTVASDKSYGFTTDDEDATGLRLELATTLIQYLSKEKISSLSYELGGSTKNTTGINPRYSKYSAAVGYMYPSFLETTSTIKLGYEYLTYPDKTTPRIDNKAALDYIITKNLTAQSSVAFSLGSDYNSSNTDLYKYDDVNVGLQYLTMFGF